MWIRGCQIRVGHFIDILNIHCILGSAVYRIYADGPGVPTWYMVHTVRVVVKRPIQVIVHANAYSMHGT